MSDWDGKTERRAIDMETKETVHKIYKILVGNGEIGMCAKVSIIWNCFIFLISANILQFIIFVWKIFLSVRA